MFISRQNCEWPSTAEGLLKLWQEGPTWAWRADDAAVLERFRNDWQREAELALQVGRRFPWWGEAGLSPELALNYVLNPRLGDERLQPWRESLLAYLIGLAEQEGWLDLLDSGRGALSPADIEKLVHRVNLALAGVASYRGTNAWTLGPLAVLKRGFGRCGEEALLLVAALRCLNIPARRVYATLWAHCDDNHAWVEYWNGETWRFEGALEAEVRADRGWFLAAASRAMLVRTELAGYALELTKDEGENLGADLGEESRGTSSGDLREDGRGCSTLFGGEPLALPEGGLALNLMSRYAVSTRLSLQLPKVPDQPSARLSLHLLNDGCFRPLSELALPADGKLELSLGRGMVLLQLGDGFKVLDLSTAGETLQIELGSADFLPLDQALAACEGQWLPPALDLKALPTDRASERAKVFALRAEAEAKRQTRLADYAKEARYWADTLREQGELKLDEADILSRALDAAGSEAALLGPALFPLAMNGRLSKVLKTHLAHLDKKDFVAFSPEEILAGSGGEIPAKKALPLNWNLCGRLLADYLPMGEHLHMLKIEGTLKEARLALQVLQDGTLRRLELPADWREELACGPLKVKVPEGLIYWTLSLRYPDGHQLVRVGTVQGSRLQLEDLPFDAAAMLVPRPLRDWPKTLLPGLPQISGALDKESAQMDRELLNWRRYEGIYCEGDTIYPPELILYLRPSAEPSRHLIVELEEALKALSKGALKRKSSHPTRIRILSDDPKNKELKALAKLWTRVGCEAAIEPAVPFSEDCLRSLFLEPGADPLIFLFDAEQVAKVHASKKGQPKAVNFAASGYFVGSGSLLIRLLEALRD